MKERQMQQRPDGYSGAAKWLHWIMAVIVLGLIPMGIALEHLPQGPVQDRAYNLHRSFGILVLALAVARVLFRRAYGAPAPYAGLTKFERIASTAVHHSLYLLIFLVPIAGWLWMSTYRAEVSIFGLFILPNLLPQNETLSAFFGGAHKFLALLMAALLIAHAGGALMHAFIKRDRVLHRMLPNAWGPALDRLQSALGKPNRS
jgi:cytochrome b561